MLAGSMTRPGGGIPVQRVSVRCVFEAGNSAGLEDCSGDLAGVHKR
jgi:hypothetical protein